MLNLLCNAFIFTSAYLTGRVIIAAHAILVGVEAHDFFSQVLVQLRVKRRPADHEGTVVETCIVDILVERKTGDLFVLVQVNSSVQLDERNVVLVQIFVEFFVLFCFYLKKKLI